MAGAGLAQLVQEIKLASTNVKSADGENRQHIGAIEDSINDLYRKVGHPPDLHLALARDDLPEQWVGAANLTLLGALRRLAPHAINWSGMQDVVPVLDAFEAAVESKTARRH